MPSFHAQTSPSSELRKQISFREISVKYMLTLMVENSTQNGLIHPA